MLLIRQLIRMDIMGVFNEKFKELKDQKNIMLKDLASDLDIGNSKLSYYLNGNSEPPYELLIKIAEYFEVTTDYLVGNVPKTEIDFVMNELNDLRSANKKLQDENELLKYTIRQIQKLVN